MKIIRYDLTDSTNERAREYARVGGEMPALFIARGQTGGRGRRGRSFDSELGAGLYMTYLYRPDTNDVALITIRAAVALARAIEKTSGLSAKIKWVNDLTVSGRKISVAVAPSKAFVPIAITGYSIPSFSKTSGTVTTPVDVPL